MPYAVFRRQPVPQQYAQALRTTTFPAPTRGIVQSENEAFMQPGGATIQDNWVTTMRGVKLRGGFIRWCVLPETTPVISAFEYIFGSNQKMFAGNATKLYDVTGPTPILIKSGQTSGNYSAAQMSTSGNDSFMIVVNETGNAPLRFNGTVWETADPFATSPITGPPGTPVVAGHNLSYVWKYRNRLFFIETGSMNAWYLDIDSIGGLLKKIPLSGSATRGGKLLFGAVFSLDAGDGMDDKCCFVTDLGEVLVFTGTNPADVANWRQEGRFFISPPLGMNAHIQIGGDLLIATVEGIAPLTQVITKDSGQLEQAMVTRNIKPLWRQTVNDKRISPWSIKKWDEYGGLFVAAPGGAGSNRYSFVANNASMAWGRFIWDATCFLRMGADMFFGTSGGIIMQAERTGTDDGLPYVCTLVGGWEMFGGPANTFVWHQSRAVFHANQALKPQLSATVDYMVTLPAPPPPGPEPALLDVWDQGKWDVAKWDQVSVGPAPVRNTLWVSIGKTGFAHAPITQVTIAQQVAPVIELIAIAATYEPCGVNV